MNDKQRIAELEAENEKLYKELEVFKKSRYAETYLTMDKQISYWNDQLNNGEVNILYNKEDKAFDSVSKYFDKVVDWLAAQDKLRSQMSEEETELVESTFLMKSTKNYLTKAQK